MLFIIVFFTCIGATAFAGGVIVSMLAREVIPVPKKWMSLFVISTVIFFLLSLVGGVALSMRADGYSFEKKNVQYEQVNETLYRIKK